MTNTPNHVAIIMDGNRRWARKRRFEVLFGHDKGAEKLREIARSCADTHINWLTVFAFSSENWTLPSPRLMTPVNSVASSRIFDVKLNME